MGQWIGGDKGGIYSPFVPTHYHMTSGQDKIYI